jgi:hypothetical protein
MLTWFWAIAHGAIKAQIAVTAFLKVISASLELHAGGNARFDAHCVRSELSALNTRSERVLISPDLLASASANHANSLVPPPWLVFAAREV